MIVWVSDSVSDSEGKSASVSDVDSASVGASGSMSDSVSPLV